MLYLAGSWLERVNTYSFFALVVCMLSYESYFFFQDVLKPLSQRVSRISNFFSTIYNDFTSGKFYKPWSPAQPLVIVSSKKHIKELSETPILSQRAVYADMFGFKYTMNNFDHDEIKVARSRLFGRLLLASGPRNLTGMFDVVRQSMLDTLTSELSTRPQSQGAVTIPCTRLSKELASKMMSVLIFGPTLSAEQGFYNALLQYPRDMINSMLAFQMTPSFASRFVHKLVTKNGKAMHTIQNRLITVMDQKSKVVEQDGKLKDFLTVWNMADVAVGSDYWTLEGLSQALLGIWFAASHQPWMNLNFVILELCARPEWQEILREEIENSCEGGASMTWEKIESLPLLNSFIKETIRMHPLDTLAVRRKAMKPFTFSEGGPSVPAGSIACVSSYGLMHDPKHYFNPDNFDGRRFARKSASAVSSLTSTIPGSISTLTSTTATTSQLHVQAENEHNVKLTSVSEKFPVWGFGSLACPGRHHASFVIKLALAHLIMNYDLNLQDPKRRTRWTWETFAMPYESTMLVMRERSQQQRQKQQSCSKQGF